MVLNGLFHPKAFTSDQWCFEIFNPIQVGKDKWEQKYNAGSIQWNCLCNRKHHHPFFTQCDTRAELLWLTTSARAGVGMAEWAHESLLNGWVPLPQLESNPQPRHSEFDSLNTLRPGCQVDAHLSVVQSYNQVHLKSTISENAARKQAVPHFCPISGAN